MIVKNDSAVNKTKAIKLNQTNDHQQRDRHFVFRLTKQGLTPVSRLTGFLLSESRDQSPDQSRDRSKVTCVTLILTEAPDKTTRQTTSHCVLQTDDMLPTLVFVTLLI